jgi:23S rRNA pseudouridine2605 synthase
MSERLQKVLANAGLGSRRELERWIEAGRVKVNGKIAKLGDKLESDDKVIIDGRKINLHLDEKPKRRVIIYHKKEGEVCTRSDPDGRPTVFDNLPRLRGERWVAIGRLDINTSGLLLLTTDGELANKLMHPSFQVPREYAVRVRGEVSNEHLTALREGVLLEDGMARFNDIVYSGGENQNQWYHVVLTEGRNREVRRLWESQGLTVSRLKRVRYGTIVLTQKIRQGKSTDLNEKEINSLEEMLDYQDPNKDKVIEKEKVPRKIKAKK